MYAKLALRNARKSIKDYLIYFVTLSLCVSLFYAFMSLTSSEYEFITEKSYNFDMLKILMKYATYIISALLILLIRYVNQYMMKRRQREFATYILLGTEQSSVAFMFFVETLVMGTLSIFIGILIGTLFSQVVTGLVLLSAKQDIVVSFRFYWDTVLITFLFFFIMFCIIGLYNVKVLKKRKLIVMLNAEKKTEFQFKRSGKVYAAVLAVSIICFGVCAYCTVHLLGLQGDEGIHFADQNIMALVGVLTFVIGIYTFFYCLAYLMVLIKEKWTNLKYAGTNLFLIGTIASKIKTAPLLLATLCVTFLGAAISFILTMVLAQWSLGYLFVRAPYDLNVANFYSIPGYYSIPEQDGIPELDYEDLAQKLKKNGTALKDYCQVEKYFLKDDAITIKDQWNMPILGISLSDFNKLRHMLGYKQIKLKDNEFAMQWASTSLKSKIKNYITNHQELEAGKYKLVLSQTPAYTNSLGEGIYNYYTEAVYILPDEVCGQLSLASTDFYANTKTEMSFDTAVGLEDKFITPWLQESCGENLTKYQITGDLIYLFEHVNIKVKEVNTILNATLAMRILGIYLGVVLLMISLTVLALQQLSDSIEHKGRYQVLKKLGVDSKEISKLILKQIAIYFFLPIFVAMIGVAIFVYNYYNIYSAQISSYIGGTVFIANIMIAIVLILVVYISYFAATYYTFKRNVRV